MRNVLFCFLLALSAVACKSTKDIIPEPQHTHDTIIVERVKADTTIMFDSVYIDRAGDTVIQYKYKYIEKIRVKNDSIYIAKTDTITNVVVKVEKLKPSWWQKFFYKSGRWLWLILLILGAFFLGRFVVKKVVLKR